MITEPEKHIVKTICQELGIKQLEDEIITSGFKAGGLITNHMLLDEFHDIHRTLQKMTVNN